MTEPKRRRAKARAGAAPFALVYAIIATLVVLAIALSPIATRRPARAHGALAGATMDDADAPRSGLIVTSLRTGGEAARAGLRTGDDIVAIDRHRVVSRRDAARVLRQHRGRSLTVDIARGGHRSRVRLKLGGGTPHGA